MSPTATAFSGLVRSFFPSNPVPLFKETEDTQLWDFSSTGCVGNISPIIGYLWLLYAKSNGFPSVRVPKAASKGTGGGTVDILEAGGYQSPVTADMAKLLFDRDGHVVCGQLYGLTGHDKAIMEARRRHNLMNSGELTLASILAKKIALGTRHVVLDIKLGQDTKLYRRLSSVPLPAGVADVTTMVDEAQLANLAPTAFTGLEVAGTSVPQLHEWLAELLGNPASSPGAAIQWVCPFSPEKIDVYLKYSNADTPQCRAVGRLLCLVQIELIVTNLQPMPELHTNFYGNTLLPPTLAGTPSCLPHILKPVWKIFRNEHLPAINKQGLFAKEFEGMKQVALAPATAVPMEHCAALTIYERDVWEMWLHTEGANGGCTTVVAINAYPLDELFQWLCGDNTYDPLPGIWLHRLPTERIAPGCPVITAFYRPDRQLAADVRRKLVFFASQHIRVSP